MRSRSGVSGVIVGLLLIMIIGASIVVFYVFAIGSTRTGIFTGTSSAGIQFSIVPNFYSTAAGIAILGEIANFTVAVQNTGSTEQRIGVNVITPGDRVLQVVSTGVAGGFAKTIIVSQLVNATGVWTVAVTSLSVKIGGYRFTVVQDQDQADFAIAQYREQELYRVLVYALLAISIAAVILAGIAVARVGRLATQLRSLSRPHETI